MRIPNPFPNDSHVRFTCKPSNSVGMTGACTELDIPDDTEEVLIEAVDGGRSDTKYVFASRIWSKWGSLELRDHLKKMKLEEEEKKLQEDKTKFAKRRARTIAENIVKAEASKEVKEEQSE